MFRLDQGTRNEVKLDKELICLGKGSKGLDEAGWISKRKVRGS